MVARVNWAYGQGDPALMLFTAARARFGLTCAPDASLLELGCAETDFIERVKKQNPSMTLTGVDVRRDRDAHGWTQIVGSAMDCHLFEPNSFDVVVMLGALEHFGLGFYQDPVDDHGDSKTMQNVARWLKPSGWVYFDVPCQPTYRITENRHFRMYAPASIEERLLPPGLREVGRAYSLPEPHAGTWCDEPTSERVPYWFVSVLAEAR